MTANSTLGIYVQVPFCQTKCTYCNFHTGPVLKSLYNPFAAAVCREIELVSEGHGFSRAGSCAQHIGALAPEGAHENSEFRASVDTVYIGGGTPSLLDPSALARILDAIRAHFSCNWQEVTLEADPETIKVEKARAWREAGFNRISLGVQSFDDPELRAAGRLHRRADIFAAFDQLRAAGFANISADLIAGLPHQTDASWEASVEELLHVAPEHVSIYMMEIDEGSRLGTEVLAGGSRYSAAALPDDDAMARFYDHACARLQDAGFEHYEISNWAAVRQGAQRAAPLRSLHNMKYWRRQPYLGLGAGAHSYDGRARWANAHDPATYVAAIQRGELPIEQHEVLTREQALEEELFLGLRLLEGIDLDDVEQQFNLSLRDRFAPLASAGLVELHGSRVRLAPSRIAVSNEVFAELMA
jgi:oxygen-independent coproporphyrinogen-3 oxidase